MLFLDISHKIEHYYQTTDVFEDCDIVSPSQSCIHDFATYTNFRISREKTLPHGTVLLSIRVFCISLEIVKHKGFGSIVQMPENRSRMFVYLLQLSYCFIAVFFVISCQSFLIKHPRFDFIG